MRLHAVRAYADYFRIGFAESRERVAKVAGFLGAARRVVLRIEVQHYRLALKVRERNRVATVIERGEIRNFVSNFHTGHSCLMKKFLPLFALTLAICPSLSQQSPAAPASAASAEVLVFGVYHMSYMILDYFNMKAYVVMVPTC